MARWQAGLLLLFASLIWGSTFTAQHLAMEHIGPILYTGARFLLGALVVLPFALSQAGRKTRTEGWRLGGRDVLGIACTGAALFTGALLQQKGIMGTSVSNAGFLTALYVPLTPVIALAVLRQAPHWAVWPAAAACTAGAYVLAGGNLSAIREGDGWIMAGAVFWAMHVLLVGAMARRTGAPFVVASGQFFVCAALGLAWGAATETWTAAGLVAAIPTTAYAGLLSVGVGFTLQVVAQRHTPAPDAAIILSMETVFAALTGMIVLGERLGPVELGGCAMILAGALAVELLPVWLPSRGRRRAPSTP